MSPEPANLFELRPMPSKLGLAMLLILPLASLTTWITQFLSAPPSVAIVLAIVAAYAAASWVVRPAPHAGLRATIHANVRIVAILLVALNAVLIYWHAVGLRTIA